MKNLGKIALVCLLASSILTSVNSFSVGRIVPKVQKNLSRVIGTAKCLPEKRLALRQGSNAASRKSSNILSKNKKREWLSLAGWNPYQLLKLRWFHLRAQWRRALVASIVAASIWVKGIPSLSDTRFGEDAGCDTRVAHAAQTPIARLSSLKGIGGSSTLAANTAVAASGVATVLGNGKAMTAILVPTVAAAVAGISVAPRQGKVIQVVDADAEVGVNEHTGHDDVRALGKQQSDLIAEVDAAGANSALTVPAEGMPSAVVAKDEILPSQIAFLAASTAMVSMIVTSPGFAEAVEIVKTNFQF